MSKPTRQEIQTARYVAAWIKAFGYPPTSRELAPALGISRAAMRQRMYRAAKRGWLRTDPFAMERNWTPAWELMPKHLRESRPEVVHGSPPPHIRPPRCVCGCWMSVEGCRADRGSPLGFHRAA